MDHPDPGLDGSFGVLFVGFMFSSAFYGCTFFQTYVFYTRYQSEDVYTKGVVAFLSMVDTVVTGLISHAMYQYFINDFTVAFDRLSVLRTFITALALTNTEALVVQLFYTYRTWILNGRRFQLPAIISVISLASFAFAIATAVQMSKQSFFIDLVTTKVELLAGLNEGFATLCNAIIVSSQYYYLRPSRQPGMRVQEGWFDLGVLHLLSRGIGFTIVQLALLITFLVIPHDFVWVCFHFIVGKVYTNSLLAMLNTRTPFRGRGLNEEESLNTKSRFTGLGASDATGSSASPGGQRKDRGGPGSLLNIESKGGRKSVAMELDVIPSRSDVGGGDRSSKSILDEGLFDSLPELSRKSSNLLDD